MTGIHGAREGQLAKTIHRSRNRLTLDQKQKVWDFVCSEISNERLGPDAVIFSSGVDGARHPSIDLNRLSGEQLAQVRDLIST